MSIQINKLFLQIGDNTNKKEKNKLSRIIVSKDFFNQSSRLPELFALVEVSETEEIPYEEALKILDKIELKIVERVQKIYNSINERKSLQTENLSEHLLELILKALNGEISYILEEKDCFGALVKNINIFVGVLEPFIADEEEEKYYFHFSYLNNIKNFLVYKQEDKYRLMDVLASNKENGASSSSKKIFSNIVSGQLDSNGFLIIANQNLINYIIPDKLKQIIISMDFNVASNYIHKMLSEIDIAENIDFAAMFIYLLDDKKQNFTPENSIEKLIITEKNTEKFLSPSIIPDFGAIFSKFFKFINSVIKKSYRSILKIKGKTFNLKRSSPKRSKHKKDEGTEQIKEEKAVNKKTFSYVKKNQKVIKIILLGIGKSILKILNFFKNVIYYIINSIVEIFRRCFKISAIKKILIIVFVVSAVLFYQITVWLNTKKVESNNKIVYNKAFSELEEKFDSLEASLIYNDLEKGAGILEEINVIMEETLAADIPEYKNKYDEFKKTISEYNQKVHKITNIENPEKLNISEALKVENIVFSADDLILVDYKGEKVYSYNFLKSAEKDLDVKIGSGADFSDLSLPAAQEDGIIFYSKDDSKFFSLNLKEKNVEVLNKALKGDVSDIGAYGDNIYSLDAKNNQIYIYRYRTGQNWLKEDGINLKNAIKIAIDGNIFALKNNGEIMKFYKGKQSDFALQDISPPLSNPSDFYTDFDTKYIYILEPANNRILVFEKENANSSANNLIAQYASSKFNDLKDFAVDEKNGIIYALNGNEVYKIVVGD